MWDWFKSWFSGQGRSVDTERWGDYQRSGRPHRIYAKYDIAETNPTESRYWANADNLSAVSAHSLEKRRVARNKSRYEVGNNCHARGITLTLANDMIGTGPRLQIQLDDEGAEAAIESPWNDWADEICLAEKMHLFALATIVDGESVMVKTLDESLYHSVKLNLDVKECDLLSTPDAVMREKRMAVDGIEFDTYGKPSVYHLLKVHPGDTGFQSWQFGANQYDPVPASSVFHWFRQDRPGQQRGWPEIGPALPIFAQLRRYTMATLAAAEIAADFAMFISTDAPAYGDPPADSPVAWDITNIDKGMLTALPQGYKPWQLTPAQPATGHNEFTKGLLREACHALLIPYNIANADFEGDSYAGGRMALQVYQRYLKVRRKHLMQRILNRIFAAWFDEAIRIPGLLKLPAGMPLVAADIPHTWFFDGWGHVDRTKEADADAIELANGTTTLSELCAEEGRDWRDVARQQGKEKTFRASQGLDTSAAPNSPAANADLPQGVAA